MATPAAERKRRSRAANRERDRIRQRAYRDRMRVLIREAKDKPCADCGQRFAPRQMHFDHVRGEKSFDLARAWNHSLEAVEAEIAKCEVRCLECHKKRHIRQRPGVIGPARKVKRRTPAQRCANAKHLRLLASKTARLTPEQAAMIRWRIGVGGSGKAVAAELGVSQAAVSRVWTGRSWVCPVCPGAV